MDQPNLVPAPTGAFVIKPVNSADQLKLSLVVPTYNEGQNIAELVRALHAALAGKFFEPYEIIVVDDNSPDETWKIAAEIAREDPTVRVLRRTKERGLATAVVRGWQVARGEVLGVIDGDLQHPPEVTAELWAEMEQGADIAVASRRAEGGGVGDWSLGRRVVSRGARLIGLMLLPEAVGKVSDPMSGCFMVRRSLLQGVRMNPLGYKILLEVMGRTKPLRVAEVGYVFLVRRKGASKATLRVYWEYLLHLLLLRFVSTAEVPFSVDSAPEFDDKAALSSRLRS
jgi:dolichol-phosphate mannosyltransferase